MKIVYYISFPGKPMALARTHGVSGSHTAAIGVMEVLARNCPRHDFILCRSSIEGVSEIGNLSYIDTAPPPDTDVLILTTMDMFPQGYYPNLKHVVYVTHTIWTPSAITEFVKLTNVARLKLSVVNLCEWTRLYLLNNGLNDNLVGLFNSPRISNHTIGNPLLDDILPELDTIREKVPHSYAFVAVWERGGDVALRAFRKIRELVPEAQFHVASYDSSPMNTSEPEPNVFIHKSLGKKALSDLLAKTERLMYPLSLPNGLVHKDTFGCVVSEALACGIRVITYRQGALEELYGEWAEFVDVPVDVHDQVANLQHGIRVPWCNSEEAVDAFVKAAMKENIREPVEVAKAVRERFSQSKLGEKFLRSVVPAIF